MTTTSQIVNLIPSVTKAPVPSALQQSGALVSLGGTTLTAGTFQYCGSTGDLQSILSTAGNFAELADMASTFFGQGSAVGVYVLELGGGGEMSIDSAIAALGEWHAANPGIFYGYLCPANWDSSLDEVGSVAITAGGTGYSVPPTVTIAAPTSGTQATATATIENGAVIGVTITNAGSGYTAAPAVTFSAPTSGTTATGTANLASALNVLASQYASPSGKTYFFATAAAVNLANYAGNKSVIAVTPSPTAVSTEFQAAGFFYQWLVNNPSSANKLAPMAYRFLYGVTPWALTGNSATINSILSAYGNLVLTGAEGGISTACQFKGTTMDGTQASWWYGIDWVQIQMKQALAAAIINGSNSNPPLIYDQDGINTLLGVAQQVGNSATKFACALSVTITAIPFYTYTKDNPDDYNAGIYKGFQATVVGQNGFLTITFYLDAVQFVI